MGYRLRFVRPWCAALGVLAGLLLVPAQGARGEPETEKREAQWVDQHVDLDLLPVAFTVPRGRLTVGGPLPRTPAGFPSDIYVLYPDLVYGLTDRTEAGLGGAGAQRLGPGGEATFYTLGLQRVLSLTANKLPTLSVGAYGFLGPQGHDGGAVYLVASRQLTRHAYPRGLFAHLGLELQGYSSDDSSAAPRPFLGVDLVWTQRLRFSAEFRQRMPWESANLYSLRTVLLITRHFGLSGGLRNNGYRTHPFIGLRLE
jgi:hypothetical protein